VIAAKAVAVLALAALTMAGCGGRTAARRHSTVTRAPISAGEPIPCALRLRFGSRSEAPPGQLHINLVIVNSDFIACRISGWPDVELIGPTHPIFGTIYTLRDQSGSAENVRLGPGGRAHAVLTWLPSSLAVTRRWTPDYLRVVVRTNRGQSFPMAVPWRYGSVERQDGATHPGTYIGPINPGTG
jgi:hypothetical protein